ncbi:MAG: Rv3235 family protein [Jiangellaceae bacterium]
MPVPVAEPPYDDEAAPGRPDPTGPPDPHAPQHATQGALALAYLLPGGLPPVPEPAVPLRLVDAARHDVPGRDDHREDHGEDRTARTEREITAFAARQPTRSAELPEPRRWAVRLAQGIVEALHGHRPLQQLIRWTDEPVYTLLERRRTAQRTTAGPRPVVRSIRVCQPGDGVVEASVVVETAGRCRALAMRLEGLDGRWRCTALEIL